MKEVAYINEFESRYSGRRDKSKRMDIYPPPKSPHPLIVEHEGKDIGCIYLHFEFTSTQPFVWIMYLRTYEKSKGYGGKILSDVCKLADLHDVILYLEPVPDKDSTLNFENLVSWYRRYGFIGGQTMERSPNA